MMDFEDAGAYLSHAPSNLRAVQEAYDAEIGRLNAEITKLKTSPLPPTTPPVTRLIFQDDFGGELFTNWNVVQQKGFNQPPASYRDTYSLKHVRAQSGNYARFEIRDGDIPPWGGGERTELLSPVTVKEGDRREFRFSMRVPEPFTKPVGNWCIVWQIHPNSDTGSPPLCLDIDRSGMINVANNQPGSNLGRTAIGGVIPGYWENYIIQARFSADKSLSSTRVYRNNVLYNIPRANLNSDRGGYMKTGIYRDAANKATMIVDFADFEVYDGWTV